jgi:hypothetical protein
LPDAQEEQAAAPAPEYWAALQEAHSEDDADPVVAKNIPAEQPVQLADAVTA